MCCPVVLSRMTINRALNLKISSSLKYTNQKKRQLIYFTCKTRKNTYLENAISQPFSVCTTIFLNAMPQLLVVWISLLHKNDLNTFATPWNIIGATNLSCIKFKLCSSFLHKNLLILNKCLLLFKKAEGSILQWYRIRHQCTQNSNRDYS